jgi:hypothetical protein
VQNADDAGASSVGFCLDYTCYGTDSTLGPRMAAWQVRMASVLWQAGLPFVSVL